MKKLFILACLFLSISWAHADDTPASAPQKNVVPNSDEVDDLITNANLRALSGSKSRWSISNSINYDGGTIRAPFAEARPNIAGASATSLDTDLNDTISLKVNLDPVNSLSLGFGIRKMAPFTGKGPSAAYYQSGGKDVDLFDPSLIYQFIYKFWGIQSVAQVGYTQYTRQDIHSVQGQNLDKNVEFDQENMYEIGDFSIGGSFGFAANQPIDSNVDYSHEQIWIDPYAEYRLNDTFNLRLVANIWNFEWYSQSGYVRDVSTFSFGVGISVTRDIYLYPNIQFVPDHITADLTNVGLTATVNLF